MVAYGDLSHFGSDFPVIYVLVLIESHYANQQVVSEVATSLIWNFSTQLYNQ